MFGELKSGVQLAIILGGILLFSTLSTGAYFWYKSKINTAVKVAVTSLELEYAKQNLKIKDRAVEATWELEKNVLTLRKERDESIKNADTKYSNLVKWINTNRVRNTDQASSGSNVSVANSTGTTEVRPEDYFGILYRQDAINLATFANEAETVRINLLACYNQYDLVRDSLIKFKQDNSKKAP